jgi:hypothetical protein
MVQVRDVQDLPALFEQFRREGFFGEVKLRFRAGRLTTMVQERTVTFDQPKPEPKAGR